MASQLQLRGGSTAESDEFVGASREVTVDTSKNTAVVHDGVTPGGHPLAKSSEIEAVWDNATHQSSVNTLVKRDVNGNFQVNEITGNKFNGLATSATDLTARTASRALASDAAGKVVASAVTSTELGHVSGVTSAIQTQLNAKQATITGAATTIASADLTASRAVTSDAAGKVIASAVTSTELGHLTGVTSAIQTQLDDKQAAITGAATTIASADLTASRVVASDAEGKVVASAVTSTELGHLTGVTSAIQTQLDAKAPLASPAFTDTPTVPTAAVGTNSTQAASTAFVLANKATDTRYGGVKVSLSGTELTITV